MNSQNPFPGGDSCCGTNYDMTVDQLLGNAYQVVKFVAMRMPFIKSVSDNIDKVIAVATALGKLTALEEKLPELLALREKLNELMVLYANLDSLLLISSNLPQLLTVHDNLPQIQAIVDNLAQIQTVASSIAEVAVVGNNIDAVVGVFTNMATVTNVNANIAAINNVSDHTTDIRTVSTNISAVTGVSANMSEVLALSQELPTLQAVAADLDDIVLVSSMQADITALLGIKTDISTVAANVADVTNFADVYYGPSSINPSTRRDGSPLVTGDMYFNTAEQEMRVYTSAGSWKATGSTVSGILKRPPGDTPIIATAGQTVVPVLGGYDPGNILVTVNGESMNPPELVATSGTDLVFVTPLAAGDKVDYFAFGNFFVSSSYTKSETYAKTEVYAKSETYNRDEVLPKADAVSKLELASVTGTIGSSLVGTKYALPGAVGRSLLLSMEDFLSVKGFGLKGDGVTDDTDALEALINWAGSQGNKTLVCPPGEYVLTRNITKDNCQRIRIIGSGRGITRFVFKGTATAGFTFNMAEQTQEFCMTDLSIQTTGANLGTGLRVTWPAATGVSVPAATLQNLEIGAPVGSPTYFHTGIAMVNAYMSTIDNVIVRGTGAGTPNIRSMNSAIAFGGNSTDIKISKSHFFFAGTGINVMGFSEGMNISQCYVVEHDSGIIFNDGDGAPGLFVSDTHVFSHGIGIYVVDRPQAFIHDCLLYQSPSATVPYQGIVLDAGSVDAQVHDNFIFTPGSNASRKGVVVNAESCSVIGTRVHSTTVGVEVTAAGTKTLVRDTRRAAGFTGGQLVVSSSASANVADNEMDVGWTALPANNASPSIGGNVSNIFLTANTAPTNYVDFLNGYLGQVIIIQSGDANTAIVNGEAIGLSTPSFTLAPGMTITLQRMTPTRWIEIARTSP